jgi:AcrR family transcriptional regulator
MNRTKRRIFDISMELFAKKGYDATSIEEITSVVGIAKGTLYYHFSSKEEILDFLIADGMKLLEHSLELKSKIANTFEEKIHAIILVEIKVVERYESLINLVMNEFCGDSKRNEKCRNCVYECVNVIEKVLKDGINNGDIKECDTRAIAFEIFGIICSGVMLRFENNKKLDIATTAKKYSNIIISGIKK